MPSRGLRQHTLTQKQLTTDYHYVVKDWKTRAEFHFETKAEADKATDEWNKAHGTLYRFTPYAVKGRF